MSRDHLLAIGIMTGNSLDGVDTILTRFDADGGMTDLATNSHTSPPELTSALRSLRAAVSEAKGDVIEAMQAFDSSSVLIPDSIEGSYSIGSKGSPTERVHAAYIDWIARAVTALRSKSPGSGDVDIVGFHGQTCAHCPPSIAGGDRSSGDTYTVQFGDGSMLAETLGLPVAYDFRSDDLMNGGEAAPLAPMHHRHLADDLRRKGVFPVAFCNGGNSGNITVVSENSGTAEFALIGWDTGPFNHFPDALVREEKGLDCDRDGLIGRTGKVNLDLLKLLFDTSVTTSEGNNFLNQAPPRSSDPQWYRLIPELSGAQVVSGLSLSFEDRLRTAEYFSAYIFFHSLSFVPPAIVLPHTFAVCGGGWKNPVVSEHFQALVAGDESKSPVLPEHRGIFSGLVSQLRTNGEPIVQESRAYGFDGSAMEARLFADAAVCCLRGIPFSLPTTTSVSAPCILGTIALPGADSSRSTAEFRAALTSATPTVDVAPPHRFWSRASAGWRGRVLSRN